MFLIMMVSLIHGQKRRKVTTFTRGNAAGDRSGVDFNEEFHHCEGGGDVCGVEGRMEGEMGGGPASRGKVGRVGEVGPGSGRGEWRGGKAGVAAAGAGVAGA